MKKHAALLIALSLGLSACQSGGTKETAGTLLGGVAGAVAGAQFGKGSGQLAATAIGTLAGAYIGSQIGQSLDRADKAAMQQTTQQSLERAPSGQTSSWSNPDSGNSGTITPTSTYKTSAGQDCREYTQTIKVDGKEETARGRACRQADGTWKIVQ